MFVVDILNPMHRVRDSQTTSYFHPNEHTIYIGTFTS